MKGLTNTVLYQLLSKLTTKELSNLERYAHYIQVHSPILKAIQLFQNMDEGPTSKEAFFLACHGPEASFSTNRFQIFFTSIREFIFEYLAVLNVQRSSMNKHQGAIKFARKRHWDNEIVRLYRRLHRQMAKSPEGLDHYHLRYQLNEMRHEIQIRTGSLEQGQEILGDWLLFEEMYLVQSLRFKCLVLDLEQSGEVIDYAVLVQEDYLQKLLEQVNLAARPLIAAYNALCKMLSDPFDLEKFFVARKLITQHIEQKAIHQDYIGDLLRLLLNHTNRLVKAQKLNQLNLIELSTFEIKHIQGSIHPLELKNIIALLTNAGKHIAAEEIIERFKNRIVPDPEGHALAYNRGVILFGKGEFSSAISIFKSIIHSSHGSYLKADGRFYLWRCRIADCVAGREFDPDSFELERENSRQFFRRTLALSETSRAFYTTYLRLFVQFYGALGDPYSQRKLRLTSLLIKTNQLSEHPLKNWLKNTLAMALGSEAIRPVIGAQNI